jgi:3-oxoacyl-ACP reductase-like protein
MSIFGSIMEKIFHAPEAVQPTAASPTAATPAPAMAASTDAKPQEVPPSTPDTKPQAVDVVDVLTKKAAQKPNGGNWQTSIVDLLKLLDLDSSLAARKELANELSVHAGADGSAEENIALHQAVMQKLAENGGTVPASFKG